MSIAAPPSPTTQNAGPSAKSVSAQLIDARIVEACKALWWAEVIRTLLRPVIAAIGLLLVWVIVDQWVYSPGNGVRIVLFAVVCVSLVRYVLRRVVPLLGSAIRPEYAARSLERDLPELRQSLTSYVTLRGDQETPGLRSRVVRSIGAAAAGRLRRHDELPQEATGTLRLWIAAAIALAVLVAYAVVSPKNSLQSAARLAVPFASIDPALRVSIRDVKPGDVSAIAGREIEISALIAGIRGDEVAFCRWALPSGLQEVVLSQESGSRRHAGTIFLPHSATGQVDYMIAAGDAEVGPFRLQVQDVPVVALQTVRYQPPKYTGQSPHTSSSGAITALDGTRVSILATTNRAVARAKIEFNPRVLGESVQATAGVTEMKIDSAGTSLSVSFPLRSARGRSAAVELDSYRIKVLDAADQNNPEPIIYPIRVIPDLPPDVAIMMPVKSPQQVPIDVQQPVEIHASDPDFGLMKIGLEIRAGIDLIAEPVLWSDVQDANGDQRAKGNRVSEYGFRPADHDLRIGDTVQIVAVAVDNRVFEHDPSVEPNITRSDPVELRITASDPRQDDPSLDEQSSPDRRRSNDATEKSESSSGGEGQPQSGGGGGGSGEPQSGEGSSGGDSSGQSQSGESSAENSGQGGSDGGGAGGDEKSADNSSGDGQNSAEGQSGKGDPSDGSSGGAGSQGGQSDQDSMSQREGQTPTGADSSSPDASSERRSSEGGSSESAAGQESSSGQPAPTGETGDAGAKGKPGADPSSDGDANSSGDPSSGGNAGDDAAGDDAAGNEAPKHDGETFERIRDYLEQKRKQQQGSGGGPKSDDPQGDSSSSSSGDQNQSSRETGSQGDPKSRDPQSPQGSDSSDKASAGDGDASNQEPGEGNSSEQSDASAEQKGSESGDGSHREDGSPSQSAGDVGEQGDGGEQGSAGNQQQSSDQQRTGDQQGTGDEKGSGDEQTGEGQSSPGEDESKSSDQNSGEGSEEQSAKSGAGKKPGSGESGKNGPTGDEAPGENEPGREQQRETDKPSDAQSRSDKPTDSVTPSGDPSSHKPSSDSMSGTGAGSDGVGEAGDSPLPPDPVNVDYAKQAADMVLDYLEDTRDAPDRDLLDKLNWTEQDLKRFADRWQNVRELEQSGDLDPIRSHDIEEALKSLGMRPPTQAGDKVKDSADSLHGIRDAGNRKPPPAAHRDAFDAFRRAVGQQ